MLLVEKAQEKQTKWKKENSRSQKQKGRMSIRHTIALQNEVTDTFTQGLVGGMQVYLQDIHTHTHTHLL